MIFADCLYNAPRQVLNARLGIDAHKAAVSLSGHHSYFSFIPSVPNPGYRFIVLDGYDISLLGWPEGHPLHEQAVATLSANNPNEEKNSNAGLEGLNKRFVKFGGGVSSEQLDWLKRELAACRDAGEKAILCCHLCLHPETCAETCLLWNFDEVLQVLGDNSDVVVATLSGHAHRDGHFMDPESGIHYRVCAGVLEAEPGTDCYGIVEVYADRIEVAGRDSFESAVWWIGGKEENKEEDVTVEKVEEMLGNKMSAIRVES